MNPNLTPRSEFRYGRRIEALVVEKPKPVFADFVTSVLAMAVIFLAVTIGLSIAEGQYTIIDQINQESVNAH